MTTASNIEISSFDEEKLIYRLPFKLTSYDTDMYARLKPGYLINLFIQAAMNSASSLGFGYEHVRHEHLFWVFSRLAIEIYKPLMWQQSGVVESWPKDQEKFIYIRDFLVYDEDGQIIARATSNWLAIDLDTKRPKVIEGLKASMFSRLKNKHALSTPPEKLFPVKEGEIFEVKTMYSDMDLNKHVTSPRYADWMMDTFSADFHSQNYPKNISINFLHETNAGESIRLERKAITAKSFAFEGVNQTISTSAFRAIVEF